VGDTVICEHLNHEHIGFRLSKCHLIIFKVLIIKIWGCKVDKTDYWCLMIT
jgi:hypothetical protein